MADIYDFNAVEKKWQAYWDAHHCFEAEKDHTKPKFYALVEFPYPSGAGMHVGHIKAYTSLEVLSRKRRMQGYNVLFPMGFDSFGLPAENYAIKTNASARHHDREHRAFQGSDEARRLFVRLDARDRHVRSRIL